MKPLAVNNRQALQYFFGYAGPWYMAAMLAIASTLFVVFVNLSWGVLLAIAAVFIIQPWFEWIFHITVLHDKPRRVGPYVFDTVVAQDHRAHHLDPRNMDKIFIPRRWLVYIYLAVSTIALVNLYYFDPTVAVSVALAQCFMALLYEWTHFWIHQDTVARYWYAKIIKRNHRNHHYRNSTYWFGVTTNIADYAIGTAPNPEKVPVVDYAKDILKA